MTTSQTDRLEAYLLERRRISAWKYLAEFGPSPSLRQEISRLRQRGYRIDVRKKVDARGRRYSEWELKENSE